MAFIKQDYSSRKLNMPPFNKPMAPSRKPHELLSHHLPSKHLLYDPFFGPPPNSPDNTIPIPFASNCLTPVPVHSYQLQRQGATSTFFHPSNLPPMRADHNFPGYSPKSADCPKPIDRVALPSEMPIGSLVHSIKPPTWGVIKIANIPYSITKQEILQFVGRQARLVPGHAVHIIMERPTAKTMDCFVELQSPADAEETTKRINRIFETGRAPRLGNRHVEVEFSSQDDLLKDLFPRAKCVKWKNGMPSVLQNTDPYSTGFAGFFTTEEIVGAIRHAEMPHRSPFCAKCPQRTYESTISTLYKFPWYATQLYTVHDRNQLFELANRHIISLVSRMKKSNTVGLDQRLLRELLHAGLSCPAFNERQKYTLCVNSDDESEIIKIPDTSKWFPFDTLVHLPNFDHGTCMYYAGLIARGTAQDASHELPNNFPVTNFNLISPFGRVWYEWPIDVAKRIAWEDAAQHETAVLSSLVLSGWMNTVNKSISGGSTHSNLTISSPTTEQSAPRTDNSSRIDIMQASSRRASECWNSGSAPFGDIEDCWGQKLLFNPQNRFRTPFHRITHSSPNCVSELDH
ncbi:hypothetical protein BO94DRAFT_593355 [Aspergillus sclerotioniger CBS 115572]|uniref:RRM domain-containing protein n=1 Tax=Aspergillus sclerotioniger CBS 115572 TaxID=1450535 RepID=A0A317WX89_9EURO|nr:hypothetical protein BO94DRAFT_593355 [Aspergillus sclerotioniger CBS 115572]PWY90511.1 hypothetical protein BO94DRAFT_593355 [Aspergillus sclerotioniger CBS 115572]